MKLTKDHSSVKIQTHVPVVDTCTLHLFCVKQTQINLFCRVFKYSKGMNYICSGAVAHFILFKINSCVVMCFLQNLCYPMFLDRKNLSS